MPEGKELVRPEPGFVMKTHKISPEKEKVFINIVSSSSIERPSFKREEGGNMITLPFITGPVRMEKDKCK